MPVSIKGSGGGSVTLDAGAAASTTTLTLPNVSGTVLQSGTTVTVAQGGTGLATLTANNVILGNGASNVQFVAPGTSGNVLTSNGTTWSSTSPATTGITIMSKTPTTSGTSVLTTGIPSGVKRIVIGVVGISMSGASNILIQLGTASGVQSTGYAGTALRFNNGGTGWSNPTNGFAATVDVATTLHSGTALLTLTDVAANTWACLLMLGNSTGTQLLYFAGYVSLASTVDRINFAAANGTDTFDAGYYTVTYE